MTDIRRIFVDTSLFIYLLEGHEIYGNVANNFFKHCLSNRIEMKTSTISYMEFCVMPYQKNRLDVIESFKELLIDLEMSIYSINLKIADLAAELRARYKFLKGMDALQIATGIYSGSDHFITNDKKLKSIREINVVLLDEWQ